MGGLVCPGRQALRLLVQLVQGRFQLVDLRRPDLFLAGRERKRFLLPLPVPVGGVQLLPQLGQQGRKGGQRPLQGGPFLPLGAEILLLRLLAASPFYVLVRAVGLPPVQGLGSQLAGLPGAF